MAYRFRLRATILTMLMVLLVLCPFAHAELKQHMLIPPFRGQFSEFSQWSIPEQSFAELTNWYINEQGLPKTRPGFYAFMNSVSTSKPILGAVNYKRWIEGGSKEYIVFNTNNSIYYTTKNIYNSNTNISAGISYADDGMPVWLIHYNDLYMANGEENPIRWNQDANCITIGYCQYDGAVTFNDTNSISLTGGLQWNSAPYHFRPGWDFIIADSNNNDGTYEVKSVDTNVIVLQTTAGLNTSFTAEADAGGTYTGVGFPPELTISRTETVSLSGLSVWFYDNYPGYAAERADFLLTVGYNLEQHGYLIDMNCTITGTTTYDGTYNINKVDGSWLYFHQSSWSDAPGPGIAVKKTGVGLSAARSINVVDSFNPSTITGHKSRLFAGGVKEFPTYLFFTISKLLSTQGSYYYDMWRDRVNTVDGSGYIDLQDKIIALIGDWQDSLIIGCENRIMRLRGDDPGFDILTPSQSLIYHPDPISLNTGFLGPNAWCEANGDIYFISKSGLQQLKMVEQGGTARYTVLSMAVNDLINDILKYGNTKKLSMQFLKQLNLILINCALDDSNNDSIIVYNIANQTFSKWTFTSGSEPNCLFNAPGVQIDPNNTSGFPSDNPDPFETCWMGSQDGKLWQLTQAYDYDRDYEDPNSAANNSFSTTLITAKLNDGNPFMGKTWGKSIFMIRELHNYGSDPNYGSVSFYTKLDNASWSSISARNFSAISGTDGAAIDQYQFLEIFSDISGGTSRTIQYKITTSHKYGLELMGILTEYEPAEMAWD